MEKMILKIEFHQHENSKIKIALHEQIGSVNFRATVAANFKQFMCRKEAALRQREAALKAAKETKDGRDEKIIALRQEVEVQRLSLFAVGNLAFCLEKRRTLTQFESLHELLLRLTVASEPHVYKVAARALAILGENENLCRAIRGKPVGKQGLRILAMDVVGMKGLATVQMLKQIEESPDISCNSNA